MKTQKGIYLDINESEYVTCVEGLNFYFSSTTYLKKFMSGVRDYIINESLKLTQKYKINISFSVFLAIAYYKQIEKRGFRIEYNNKKLDDNFYIYGALSR